MTRADGLFIKTFVFVFSVSLAVFVFVCLFLCLFLSIRADFLKAEAHTYGNHTAAIVWQYYEQKHTEMAITQALYGNTTSRNTLRRQSHKQWFEFIAFIFHIFSYPILSVKCISRILIYVCT